MAFTKIENSDFDKKGALALSDRPSETKSPQEIKTILDAPARQVITPAFNNLIDELEDTTAAASIGAVAPVGARGNTVQAILNGVYGAISTAVVDVSEIKAEISSVIIQVDALEDEAHTHSNKELLDTYEQSESDLADAVTKKHAHSNKSLLDTYTQTNDNLADAVSKKHSHDNQSLLDTYTQTESNLADAVSKKHSHSNKSVLDKFGESSGKPTYDGTALPTPSDIPDSLSDLSDDSTHRLVTDTEKSTWNGKMNNDGSNSASIVRHSGSFTVGIRGAGSTVGNNSVSEGHLNTASGQYSHAEGEFTVASGAISHSEGSYSTASGNASHAEGNRATASGTASHAEGSGTIASGNFSHAGGQITTAAYDKQFVHGSVNDNKSTTLFEIGNGYYDEEEVAHPSNAFEIYNDGAISQDNGTTKFKFTSYNGDDGYYDKNGTFHEFGGGGSGTGDMKKSDYDSDSTVKNANGIKAYVQSQIAGLMVKNTYDSDSAVANAGGIKAYVNSQISAQITSALTASY